MAVREHYSHAKADKHKEKKRKEAEERVEARAGRSDEAQLQKLDIAGHKATKEKKRLRERINLRRRMKNEPRNNKNTITN